MEKNNHNKYSKDIDFSTDFTEEEEAVFNTKPVKNVNDLDSTNDIFIPKAAEDNEKTLTQEEAIVKKYIGGMGLKEIVKQHNISYGKVYALLARNNITLRSGRHKTSASGQRLSNMTEIEKQSIINDYKNDEITLKEIYEKYNINKNGVYIILDEAGVPRHKKTSGREVSETATEMTENIKSKEESRPVHNFEKPSNFFYGPNSTITINKDIVRQIEENSLSFTQISFDGITGTLNITVSKEDANKVKSVMLNFEKEEVSNDK